MVATKNSESKDEVLKPPALKKGDKVALLAPSSRPSSHVEVSRAAALVKEMGFKPIIGKHVLDSHGYMAGSDKDRLADLNDAIRNPQIKGVFMLCGGYGALPLLPHIDYDRLKKDPKVFVGSGDTTSILLALHKVTGLVVFHGPNLIDIRDKQSFRKYARGIKRRAALPFISPNEGFNERKGEFHRYCYSGLESNSTPKGRLIGGNLTSMASLLGTEFEVDCKDRILFINDSQERNDILDRWLTSLTINGALDDAKALVFGEFIDCYQRGSYSMHSIFELILERMHRLKKPHLLGFPLGEGGVTSVLPIGVRVKLDSECRMYFQERALALP